MFRAEAETTVAIWAYLGHEVRDRRSEGEREKERKREREEERKGGREEGMNRDKKKERSTRKKGVLIYLSTRYNPLYTFYVKSLSWKYSKTRITFSLSSRRATLEGNTDVNVFVSTASVINGM
jgi:hypothetical protein